MINDVEKTRGQGMKAAPCLLIPGGTLAEGRYAPRRQGRLVCHCASRLVVYITKGDI